MSFNPNTWSANVTRISERKSLDSLDVDRVRLVTIELASEVTRWGVFKQVQVKIARAIVERDLSPRKVGELIETTILRSRLPAKNDDGSHNKNHVVNPGAFFVTSVKRELERNGHTWHGKEKSE